MEEVTADVMEMARELESEEREGGTELPSHTLMDKHMRLMDEVVS